MAFFAVTASCFVTLATAAWAQAEDVLERPSELRVALYDHYMPLSGTDLAGEPAGMLADIWRLWSEKTDVPVRFVRDDFQASLDAVRDGRADVHAGLFRNSARAEWLDFSRAIFESNSHFYYWRDGTAEPTIASLGGRAIGVVGGSFQETFLRDSPLRYRPRAFADMEQMLRALARGEIAAFLHEAVPTRSLLIRTGVTGRVDRIPNDVIRNAVHPAIPKATPNVRALVDWGMSLISRAEFAQIEQRWIEEEGERFFRPQGTELPLNDAEVAWLAANQDIRVGVQADWAPMSSVPEEGGAPDGMSVAIMSLVNERLGGILTFEADEWRNLMDKTADGRLDAMIDMNTTATRAPTYHFTSPYLLIPHVLVARGVGSEQPQITDMAGKIIAVEEGYSTVYYIQENYPRD
jgi:ABC-type amino acid transport substrate-binding protein